MSESFSVRPAATIGVSAIAWTLSKAPSTRMKARGPWVSIEPAGVTVFCRCKAAAISCADTPRVASLA